MRIKHMSVNEHLNASGKLHLLYVSILPWNLVVTPILFIYCESG